METGKLVSLIILTWNRKEDLRDILSRIRDVRYHPLEVIVVDNSSTDGTVSMVSEEFPDVVFIGLSHNSGIAGYNRGVERSRGEYIVFLDSDSYPATHSISKMVRLFETHPRVGAVAFDVHHADTWTEDQPGGPDPGSLGRVWGYNGAGVGFRRSLFEKTGPLFEELFLYCNEIDHSIGILKAGYEIWTSPEIMAYHKNSNASRIGTSAPYFFTRNLMWVAWRHYPLGWAVRITLQLIYHGSKSTFGQKTGIYIRAVLDACKRFPDVLSHRAVAGDDLLRKIRLPIPLIFTWYR